MLEALVTLAATAGSAVVQAAGTDLWASVRDRVAQLFGRGDQKQTQRVAERLDNTASILEKADEADSEQLRSSQQVSWQTRFTDLLEGLDGAEREQAAGQLRELVDQVQQRVGGVSAGSKGMAVGGNVNVHADRQSGAAGYVSGGMNVGNPPPSRPGQD